MDSYEFCYQEDGMFTRLAGLAAARPRRLALLGLLALIVLAVLDGGALTRARTSG